MANPGIKEYNAERHPRLARALARDGYIDTEIAKFLNISKKTLNVWKKTYPDFYSALQAGKLEVDLLVEDSLLKRALGYEYEETEITATKDGAIKEGKPMRVKKTKKFLAPDVTAQIFWLKNRQPKTWRDRQITEHTGIDGGPIEHSHRPDLSGLTDEELASLEHILRKSTKC